MDEGRSLSIVESGEWRVESGEWRVESDECVLWTFEML